MPRKRKNPGEVSAVVHDDPEITRAKLKVLLKNADKKLKEHDLPDDVEAILERYQKAKNAIRHARAQAKATWKRLVGKCKHKEGKTPPWSLPPGWNSMESTIYCRNCGVAMVSEEVAAAIVAAPDGEIVALPAMPLNKAIDELIEAGTVADLESMAVLQKIKDGVPQAGAEIRVNVTVPPEPVVEPADVSQPDFHED